AETERVADPHLELLGAVERPGRVPYVRRLARETLEQLPVGRARGLHPELVQRLRASSCRRADGDLRPGLDRRSRVCGHRRGRARRMGEVVRGVRLRLRSRGRARVPSVDGPLIRPDRKPRGVPAVAAYGAVVLDDTACTVRLLDG